MIVPAAIYSIVNFGGDGAHGWGVPMATDIAFAAGCIAMLRKWVPSSLMVFLVALAIVDDLGAVTVIALFYTDSLDIPALVIGAAMITVSFAMGLAGVRRTMPYVLIGIVVWFAFLRSGVHATIAGVLLAFTIPTDARYRSELFEERIGELLKRFTRADKDRKLELAHPEAPGRDRLLVSPRQQGLIRAMNEECHHVEAPLQRIEHNLEPWTVFVIMPIFAFANSGLHLEWSHLGELIAEPVALGVIFGLVIGKQLGIVGACFAAVKSGLATLPAGVNFKQVWAVSCLAGIGFTMSLFIAELAFPANSEHAVFADEAKLGIFIGSIVSGVLGLVTLRLVCTEVQPDSKH
jgi:NhaA family Na+:H+ antiporter